MLELTISEQLLEAGGHNVLGLLPALCCQPPCTCMEGVFVLTLVHVRSIA